MVENSAPSTKLKIPRLNLAAWLRSNPVVQKELRGRMRGNRGFVLLTAYLLIMAVIVSIVYLVYFETIDRQSGFTSIIDARKSFGKVLFALILGLETFGACVISPSLTASGITSEREHQTFDLLRTTLLSPRALVYGKFFSGLGFILLMLLAALPLQSLVFLFGGVVPEEVLVNTLILIVTAAGFCAIGVFCSSLFKSSKLANGVTYGISVIWVVVLPGIILVVFSVFSSTIFNSYSNSAMTAQQEMMLMFTLWHLLSLNPIATIIATETLAIEEQSFLTYQLPLTNGIKATVLSPWILYVLLSIIVTFALLAISMRLVRRMEN